MQRNDVSNTPKSMGRPSAVTDETGSNKLHLKEDLVRKQLVIKLKIDRSTFYRHLRSDPYFATQISNAAMYLYLAATETIFKKITVDHDPKIVTWYLEKVGPERWANKKLYKEVVVICNRNIILSMFILM